MNQKKVIEWVSECDSCNGTGIYIGYAERNASGIGVVCSNCKGSGKSKNRVSYTPFVSRHRRNNVKKVLQANPGIYCSKSNPISDFGGMPYADWLQGKSFQRGMEMRLFTCPAWWYQHTNYKRKPEWKECISMGSFSSCYHFPNKGLCWIRFDKEKL